MWAIKSGIYLIVMLITILVVFLYCPDCIYYSFVPLSVYYLLITTFDNGRST